MGEKNTRTLEALGGGGVKVVETLPFSRNTVKRKMIRRMKLGQIIPRERGKKERRTIDVCKKKEMTFQAAWGGAVEGLE